MSENGSNLFRKSSLERVSSPEQLNEYIKVTNPSLIAILIGIFTILTAGAVWIFSGGIPKTVDMQGVIVKDLKDSPRVYCYVPVAASKRIKEGMSARVSPEDAPSSEYGYINGTVLSVSDDVVTAEYLNSKFDNPQTVLPLVSSSMQNGNVMEIEIGLGEWSNEKGNEVEIVEGTNCTVSAIVGETKLYELIFENK